MCSRDIEKLYLEIEKIEMIIENIEFSLLEIDVIKNVYDKLLQREPDTYEMIPRKMEVFDYFNWTKKVTLVAKYNKRLHEGDLLKMKKMLDNILMEGN